jgi:hypothetical protein
MEYLAVKNKIMLFAGKWMELEVIMLNKINQTRKDKYCMFSVICLIQEKKKIIKVQGELFGKRKGIRRRG